MFVVGGNKGNINEYTLTTPFDVSTAEITHVFPLVSQSTKPRGMAFSNDGIKMFVTDDETDSIYEYNMSAPFKISTARFSNSIHVFVQDASPSGLEFSNDGIKMFLVGSNGDKVHEYTLTTPFVLSTATPSNSFSVMKQDTFSTGMAFSNDGYKMFVVGAAGQNINEYILTTPFDVSTASYNDDAERFSVSRQDSFPTDIAFSNNGDKMFIVGNHGNNIHEYALNSVYPIVGSTDVFITTWKTTAPNESITIPAIGTYTIDWGDGTIHRNVRDAQQHAYATADTYTVKISGDLEAINTSLNTTNARKILSIEQWGNIEWTTMNSAFRSASSMVYNADDAPDLSGVTDMASMFAFASAFNGNISNWDVSSVTSMDDMFNAALVFNKPLSSWNVSSVTRMNQMFSDARAFNGNISSWDVSSVTRTDRMFSDAISFNQPLSSWNVSSVTLMFRMFASATAFNQDIDSWDVSSVDNTSAMFFNTAAFNGNISSWDVSSVDNTSDMFLNAIAFNGNISSWNVSSATAMDRMFLGATLFDQNLGNWYVVPADTAYNNPDGTLNVTTISAQNAFLDAHSPSYGIGIGGNSTLFNITDSNTLMFKSAQPADTYIVNVTASGDNVFESGNWRLLKIDVTGRIPDTESPTIHIIGYPFVTTVIGDTYIDAGATCKDDMDADKHATVGGNMINTNAVGQHTVTYSCTDEAGNSATQVSRIVNVEAPPPTFVSSEFDTTTGALMITFSEDIDVTPARNVDATKIHIRESGTHTGGVTLTASKLSTDVDDDTISFMLTLAQQATVARLSIPELTIDPGAVRGIFENLIIGSFDISTATHVHSLNVTAQDETPSGMAFSNDGYKMFVVGWDGKNINEYTLTTPFDLSTATYAGNNEIFSVSLYVDAPAGMAFSIDGAKMFVVDYAGSDITEYTLTTPFDVSTASYNNATFPVLQDNNSYSMAFSNDGTKMFVLGANKQMVNEYTLTTPFDISTATYVGNNERLSVSEQDTFPTGIVFSNDGTKMFMVGAVENMVNEYTLTTPFDVSTASFDDVTFDVSGQDKFPQGMAFSNDGNKMFVVGNDGNAVYEYALRSVYPISITESTPPTFVSSELDTSTGVLMITFSEAIDVTPAAKVDTTKIHIRESGTYTGGVTLTTAKLNSDIDDDIISFTLTLSHLETVKGLAVPELTIEPGAVQDTFGNLIIGTFDISTASHTGEAEGFSVSGQDRFPTGMAFSNDGYKMFVSGNDGDDISEYTLSAPFDISTASHAGDTERFSVLPETGPTGITFSNDGYKMFVSGNDGDDISEYTLITPFDISTATHEHSFSVSVQDGTPTGITFSNDGYKMFVIGIVNDNINEYTLTTPFDISTASYANNNERFSVSLQDGTPTGMAFSNDGYKMFVVGDDGDDISEYILTTPFDVSTATYNDVAFSVSMQDGTPTGMAFSNDGDKMFIVGNDGDDISEYKLSPVYPIVNSTDVFITTWKTDTFNESITIPAIGTYTIDWGDGHVHQNVKDRQQHTYALIDTYTVRIYGDLEYIDLSGDRSNAEKLQSIEQWGNIKWSTMNNAFRDASNMVYNANDAPDLSGVTGMSNMFNSASKFNGNLSSWDVSKVTDMSYMFWSVYAFNGDISSWDVSKVTNMHSMFHSATSFNGNLSSWDVSKVTGMTRMFNLATAFNGDISNWDVSSVTTMFKMFAEASSVNQSLNDWDVSKVTNMQGIFSDATVFNGNISSWDVSSATNMDSMFATSPFNGNISTWNVSSAINMHAMFADASVFNGDLSSWDVSSATDMTLMFDGASDFDQNLGNWYVTLEDMTIDQADVPGIVGIISAQNSYLSGTNPTYGIATGSPDSDKFTITGGDQLNMNSAITDRTSYTVNVTASGNIFENGNNWKTVQITLKDEPDTTSFDTTWQTSEPNQLVTIPLEGSSMNIYWDDGHINTNASGTISHTYKVPSNYTVRISGDLTRINLNGHVDAPKLISIDQWGNISWNTMKNAFKGATNMVYNANDSPDLTLVRDMSGMFYNANAFDGDLSSWDVSSVTDISEMFKGAVTFNHPLNSWNVSSVTNMGGMFKTTAFNHPLNSWDVSSVTNMREMFNEATHFNHPLNSWNVSSVTNMSWMFNIAFDFNQNLTSWDVSGVTSMHRMFHGATSFNGDISTWDVSRVTSMARMFVTAASFNHPLNSWNVSSVTRMNDMFTLANAFDQPLNSWDVSSVTDMQNMFHGAASFNRPLNSWNVSSVTRMDDMFTLANAFDQNLGNWYVTLDTNTIAEADIPGVVGTISAQNTPLKSHSKTYAIVADDLDADHFEIILGNRLNMTSTTSMQQYSINVTASGDAVFESDNNWRLLEIEVTDPVENHFVTTWKTIAPNESITIPATGSYIIKWSDDIVSESVLDSTSHEYQTPGTYTVRMYGDLKSIDLSGDSVNAKKLQSIEQWGNIEWTIMENAFKGATNMTYNADDVPDLSGVTDMRDMFSGASKFNGDLSSWNVSTVTDMSQMFFGASKFNGNLSSWDVSKVTDMSNMFNSAFVFNGNLSSWDVSKVTDMSAMFYQAVVFNGDLSRWDVSSVINMENMFNLATAFGSDLSNWDVSKVTNMQRMFIGAQSFNGNISSWNVSSVTTMFRMFAGTILFNGDLSSWNVSSVTDMAFMFTGASSFNQNLGNWYVAHEEMTIDQSDVPGIVGIISPQNSYLSSTDPIYGIGNGGDSDKFTRTGDNHLNMISTTTGQTLYTVNITAPGNIFESGNNWKIIQITLVDEHGTTSFDTTWRTDSPDQTITIPLEGSSMTVYWDDDQTDTNLSGTISHTYKIAGDYTVRISGDLTRIHLNGHADAPKLISIDQWGNTSWDNMENAFMGASNMRYNADDTPNLSGVTDMSGMFSNARLFNGDLSSWVVSSVTDMSHMFSDASSFDGNISGWDVSSVTDMSGMFNSASSFKHPLDSWDVSSVTNMSKMFRITYFNQPLNSWNVSSVTSMNTMFDEAYNFNQTINSWDVSSVRNMAYMFNNADGFNQNINAWDVSSVTDMTRMFYGTSFDRPLNSWNVSKVTHMSIMFGITDSFNQPLDSWDVSSVIRMDGMFRGATAFNQNLNSWNVSSVMDMADMFEDASLFDQNLGNWYVTLDTDTIASTDIPGIVGTISAQNTPLRNHSPTYAIVDDDRFEISPGNQLNMTSVTSGQSQYSINVTASGTSVFESDNNWILLEIKVTGQTTDTTPLTDDAFITTWKTTTADELITLPIIGSDMTVNWGDGNTTTASGSVSHTYNTAGDYTVQITGDLTRFNLNSGADASKLVSLDQWGNTTWETMQGAFRGADSMVYNADDAPNLSGVTDMTGMFAETFSFNGDLSSWNVSSVTDMSDMFYESSFNGNISSWDVSSVTDMSDMFIDAYSFNGNISSWDVSSVTDMSAMFFSAASFNGDLSSWNVSSVTDMSEMLASISFNQPLSSWDVSSVTDMSNMFAYTSSFNQTLSSWDVSSVTNMTGMFSGASSFNQTLSSWNVSSVTDMSHMFSGASSFNQPLNSWNVSSVTDMLGMFAKSSSFDQNLGNWFIVLDSNTFAATDDVLRISTQSYYLDQAKPVYTIDDARFVIGLDDPVITLNSSATVPNDSYQVTITVNMPDFGPAIHSLNTEINVQVNTPPTVTGITGDAAINEGASGTLTGTATDGDGTVSSYSWSVNNTSAVTITTGNAATLQYTASQVDSDTAVTFTLTVTDDDGATGSDTYDVTINNLVANQPPTVTGITGDAAINEGASGTLTGTATDGDGTVSSYSWSVNNTSAVTITTGNAATLQYTASQVDSDTAVTFTLTVTDDDGATGSDTYDVTINNLVANQPPTVTGITGDAAINEGASGTLTGTATDGDGTVSSYSWSVNNTSAVTITTGNAATLQYTASQVDSDTAVTFTLTVTDDDGATGSDTYDVTINNLVANQPPTVTGITGDAAINEGASARSQALPPTVTEPYPRTRGASTTPRQSRSRRGTRRPCSTRPRRWTRTPQSRSR